jgi:hypothetical protein
MLSDREAHVSRLSSSLFFFALNIDWALELADERRESYRRTRRMKTRQWKERIRLLQRHYIT